jgi:hypothetical protein
MMTMIVSDDEEFANCWRRSRCEYLREVFVVVSLLAFASLSVHCDGMQKSGGRGGKGVSPAKKRKKERKKNRVHNLKQEEEKRYDSPGKKIIQIIDLA